MKKFPYKVSAIFDDRNAAESTLDGINAEYQGHVAAFLVTPEQDDIDSKLEPETGAVKRELLANIFKGVVIGLVAGVIAIAILLWAGISFVLASPMLSLGWLLFYAAASGGAIGGIRGLRVSDGAHLSGLKDALSNGRIVIVAHAQDKTLASKLKSYLSERALSATMS